MPWQPWDSDDYPYFDRPKPRAVTGGIKAQSKRGRFGASWWGRRWIEVLESFELGGRLSRGRSYARRGQVVSIEIDKGLVRAVVQGSRPEPYEVTIKIRPLRPLEWRTIARELSAQAVFAARLLAGEMPREIEDVFARKGVSLFPGAHRELATACSCPDWSNPCKHVAAVYYLIGEQFDRDPFLLFRLRGLARDELAAVLMGASGRRPARQSATRPSRSEREEPAAPSRRLDVRGFWNAPPLVHDAIGPLDPPTVTAALPRRLGSFPFWRGETLFLDAMASLYGRAARHAIERLAGPRPQRGDKDL